MAAPRILVVVDDEHARGLLVAVLRADGHTVDAAADRAETRRMIDLHAYTVVVSALRLRDLDGPGLVRLLEERRPLEMPSLIFVARAAFAPGLAHFLMESAASLLEWPCSPAAISRIVARSLLPASA